jgi:hypothetical protein
MSQLPIQEPFDGARDAARAPDARSAAPRTDDAVFDTPVLAGPLRRRVCVLCGHPLRAGQPMVRIQGSTIHARCSSTGRSR